MPNRKTVEFFLDEELKRHMSPEAKRTFLQEWYRYMFPFIPFDTGMLASLTDLSGQQHFSPEQALQQGLESIENNIHFKAPYATNQNNGDDFNFTRDLHTLAQAHWEQVAADLYGDKIVEATKKYVTRKGVK